MPNAMHGVAAAERARLTTVHEMLAARSTKKAGDVAFLVRRLPRA